VATADRANAEVAYLKNLLKSWKVEESEWKDENDRLRWGLQWMLNNLTGIDHEWAKEACNIARQSLNPQPKG
jgi:hypothetical protein